MTALGKLVRTTTFKIVAVYLLVFAVIAGALILYLARHTQDLVVSQLTETVEAEVRSLNDQYRIGGIRRLVAVVDQRAAQPGSNLYLVTTYAGVALAGNVTDVPTSALDSQGWTEITYRRPEGGESDGEPRARARVLPAGRLSPHGRPRLRGARAPAPDPGGAGALGRGVARRLSASSAASWWRAACLGRIDAMTASSGRIMAGDLAGRLPVAGSGDEFDRLANSLNTMLERIEGLMAGLKHVSDNIAHDLKTPLTRLRNRAEEALRTSQGEAGLSRRAGSDARGIRAPHPHLRRAPDDRAGRGRRGARGHGRFRRRRGGEERGRALRAARRGERHDARGRGRGRAAGARTTASS